MIYYSIEDHRVNCSTNSAEFAKANNLPFVCENLEKDARLEKGEDNYFWEKGFAPVISDAEIALKKIEELEDSVTKRNLRGAILGDKFALEKITTIEKQIIKLRKQINNA